MIEGLGFLSTQTKVRMAFLIDMAAMVLAAPRALLPAIGAELIGGGELTMGLLLAASAMRAFLAGMFPAPVGRVHCQGLAVFFCVSVWGASIVLVGVPVIQAARSPAPSNGSAGAWHLRGRGCHFLGFSHHDPANGVSGPRLRGRLQGVFIVMVAGGLACSLVAAALMRWEPGFMAYDTRRPVSRSQDPAGTKPTHSVFT